MGLGKESLKDRMMAVENFSVWVVMMVDCLVLSLLMVHLTVQSLKLDLRMVLQTLLEVKKGLSTMLELLILTAAMMALGKAPVRAISMA